MMILMGNALKAPVVARMIAEKIIEEKNIKKEILPMREIFFEEFLVDCFIKVLN